MGSTFPEVIRTILPEPLWLLQQLPNETEVDLRGTLPYEGFLDKRDILPRLEEAVDGAVNEHCNHRLLIWEFSGSGIRVVGEKGLNKL